jgi:uncharacterized protein YjiS (DUF1127 family)
MQHILQIIVGPAPPRVAGFLHCLEAKLALWRCRNRTRRQLAMLDARALTDLGLSPAQQSAEAGKWFWQP